MPDKVRKYIDDKRLHFYKDEDGRDIVEFYVDNVYSYNKIETNNLPLFASKWGNTSVWLPKGSKTKIIFVKNEKIFCGSQLNQNFWTVDEKNTLRTKCLCTGLMISAILSRAMGFSMQITLEQLLVITEHRKSTKYTNEGDATYLNGNTPKIPPVSSPFVQYLKYGT